MSRRLLRIILLIFLCNACSPPFQTAVTKSIKFANEEVDLTVQHNDLPNSEDNINRYLLCFQFQSAQAYQNACENGLITYLMDDIKEDARLIDGNTDYPCLNTHGVFDQTSYRAFAYMDFSDSQAECLKINTSPFAQQPIKICDNDQ